MQLISRRLNIMNLMNVLAHTTANRLVGLYVDIPRVGREPSVQLSQVGQDVVVQSKDGASIQEAGVEEAIISRLFKVGDSWFITGCTELDRFFKQRAGAQIMSAIIEAFGQVRTERGAPMQRLHQIGPTETCYFYTSGEFLPFSHPTGMVVTDVHEGKLYAIKREESDGIVVSIDESSFEPDAFEVGWDVVATAPNQGDRIRWAGQLLAGADGRLSMDARFNGRRGRILRIEEGHGNWNAEHDATQALAYVDYGTPAIITVNHDVRRKVLDLSLFPVRDIPSAFRGYVT